MAAERIRAAQKGFIVLVIGSLRVLVVREPVFGKAVPHLKQTCTGIAARLRQPKHRPRFGRRCDRGTQAFENGGGMGHEFGVAPGEHALG